MTSDLYASLYWLATRARARLLLMHFSQPMTVTQIAHRLQIERDVCGHLLRTLLKRRFVVCYNQRAQRSRVYGISAHGRAIQDALRDRTNLPRLAPPEVVDWHLYGWVCFCHRAAILKVLTHPLQPAMIKRAICKAFPDIRISANNVRDIMRKFLINGIVYAVRVPKRAHPRYALTDLGARLQHLLITGDAQHPQQ